MKKLLFSILALSAFASCTMKTGSGNVTTQNRDIKNFKGISAGGSFDVKIRQGDAYKVRVEADDNIIDDIETEINGDRLEINFRSGVSLNNITARIYVEAPEFKFVGGSASAKVESENTLESNSKIKVDASSAAEVNISVNSPEVEAECSSGSTLTLKGKTKNIDSQASSGAQIKADELLSENAKADASSGAGIELHASVNLNGEASSGASIGYRGNPAVSKKESSGGSVIKRD